jgi:hypothetical protein
MMIRVTQHEHRSLRTLPMAARLGAAGGGASTPGGPPGRAGVCTTSTLDPNSGYQLKARGQLEVEAGVKRARARIVRVFVRARDSTVTVRARARVLACTSIPCAGHGRLMHIMMIKLELESDAAGTRSTAVPHMQ